MIDPIAFDVLKNAITQDCDVLKASGSTDYSFLLGIHNIERGDSVQLYNQRDPRNPDDILLSV